MELHGLTAGWLEELNLERPSHFLARGATEPFPGMQQMAAMLEQGAPRGLEPLLDDTSPDDLLSRLEHAVFAMQASALRSILGRASDDDRPAVRNQLEQSSWKAGRACAAARWPELDAMSRADLRGVLAAFRSTPLSGASGAGDGYLIKRAVSRELEIELRACPHESPYLELRDVAGELCALHAQWARGFVYEINTQLAVEYLPRSEAKPGMRCGHRWHYPLPQATA